MLFPAITALPIAWSSSHLGHFSLKSRPANSRVTSRYCKGEVIILQHKCERNRQRKLQLFPWFYPALFIYLVFVWDIGLRYRSEGYKRTVSVTKERLDYKSWSYSSFILNHSTDHSFSFSLPENWYLFSRFFCFLWWANVLNSATPSAVTPRILTNRPSWFR